MTPLAKRMITAFATMPLFLGAVYFEGLVLMLLVVALVGLALWEFSRFLASEAHLDYLFIAGLSWLLIAYNGMDSSWITIWILLQPLYYLVRSSLNKRKPLKTAANILGPLYIALPLSFLWVIRVQFGFAWILFAVLIAWFTDTGAFFVGRKWGRTPLSTAISPAKTVEGSLGGLLSAGLFAFVFATVVSKSIPALVLLGLFLSIAGQVGDLAESVLKRESVVKDSGALLPGHGGVLDRFDSLLFILPILYGVLVVLNPNGVL